MAGTVVHRAALDLLRRRGRLSRDDNGNAIVEFAYLAVLLMVPLVYVLLSVFTVQRAAYAVSSAVREAGRVYVGTDRTDGADVAGQRALLAASIVMADSSLELSRDDLRITCSEYPCLTPGGRVDVAIAYDVRLPLLPGFLTGSRAASVQVTSRHLELVDRYRAGAG